MVLGEIEGRGEWLVLGNILYYDIPLCLSLSLCCYSGEVVLQFRLLRRRFSYGFFFFFLLVPRWILLHYRTDTYFVLFCFKNGGIRHSTTRSFNKRRHCKNDHVFETTVTLWNDNYILRTTSSRVIQKWAKNDKKR